MLWHFCWLGADSAGRRAHRWHTRGLVGESNGVARQPPPREQL